MDTVGRISQKGEGRGMSQASGESQFSGVAKFSTASHKLDPGKQPGATDTSQSGESPVRFGVDVLLENPSEVPGMLQSGSWGMVTNDAARLAAHPETPSRQALQNAGFPVTQLFSPEHGISRYGADGKAMDDQTDPVTGLPVFSLYGKTMRPPAEILSRLDGVFFDIPDIGSRFYTYIWTLSHVLEACAKSGTPLVVLDRVNPIGGDPAASEGPLLDTTRCESFLGRAEIPVRHSFTAGEFALWLNAHWKLHAEIHVIPVKGWKRSMHWPDCGLPFVPTSPAMPSYASALCYPGTCLFEATNVSAGRGTAIPFQQIGAPWIRSTELLQLLQSEFWDFKKAGFRAIRPALPGVTFEEASFTPDDNPWKGEICHGVRFEVTDRQAFRPVRTGLALLTAIRHLFPASFAWSTYPTAANPAGEGHFERLIGSVAIRSGLESSPASFLKSLEHQLDTTDWQKASAPFLITGYF